MSKPEDCLKFLKSSFKLVLEQVNTKTFRDSLDLLNGGTMKMAFCGTVVHHNGLDLWSEGIGDPTRPTILVISGAGAHARFWTNSFCDTLVKGGYFVIRFDHRDSGLSSAVDFEKEPYSVMDLCEDVIAILDAWNIKKAHVVGHSMGGTVAQLLAIFHPDRLISLTSISVSVLGIPAIPSKEVMDTLLENKPTQDFEESLDGFMRSWNVLNGELPLDVEMAKEYTKELYTRSLHPVGIAWNHIRCQERLPDFSAQLGKVTIPVLFLHGGADPLIPSKMVLKAAHVIPDVSVEILPKMGHMMFHKGLQQQIATLILKHVVYVDQRVVV